MQHSDAQHNDALLCVQSHAAQDGGCVLLGVTARGHLLTWNPDAVGAIPTVCVCERVNVYTKRDIVCVYTKRETIPHKMLSLCIIHNPPIHQYPPPSPP